MKLDLIPSPDPHAGLPTTRNARRTVRAFVRLHARAGGVASPPAGDTEVRESAPPRRDAPGAPIRARLPRQLRPQSTKENAHAQKETLAPAHAGDASGLSLHAGGRARLLGRPVRLRRDRRVV